MRFSQEEKYETIRLVSASELGVNRTLRELGIHKSTFYKWYDAFKEKGYDGLLNKPCKQKQYWNRLSDKERQTVVEIALEHPEKSSREVACYITDTQGWYVSESTVYRILKAQGLIQQSAYDVIKAADEYKDKTVRVNELWQTDFTYFKIVGWGWYYLSTILDDYSRYIIAFKLCKNMKATDVQDTLDVALQVTGLTKKQMPRLLSDNGSCYVSNDLKTYLHDISIKHIRGRIHHPQTQGKIERYHRSMKNVIKLDNYYAPEELERAVADFVKYYNYHRYHESINNLTPADVYYGRGNRILERRAKTKLRTLSKRKQVYLKTKSIQEHAKK